MKAPKIDDRGSESAVNTGSSPAHVPLIEAHIPSATFSGTSNCKSNARSHGVAFDSLWIDTMRVHNLTHTVGARGGG